MFAKVKNWLGFCGVKVELDAPWQIDKAANELTGTVKVTSKGPQELLTLDVELREEFTTGRGDDETTKTFTLGEFKVPLNKTIGAGETIQVPFTMNYAFGKSAADELVEKGGALGALGKLGKFANAEKSKFQMVATCDVKGVALDPNDIQDVNMV
jgi:hypothetical protein